jgi:endonuclease/exonuclease/phosphatase family metal-dependent hydrolase
MRIVNYNILDGGEGRADPLAEVILAQRPDLVALVEADNLEVLERIGRRLEMDYIRAQGACQHAVALLSRWPIVQSINHGALRGGPPCLLEALVRRPDGAEWLVGVAHLHHGAREADEAQREQELAALLEVLAPHRQRGQAHILCGDFNADSPIQQIDPEQVKPSTREAWEANGGSIPRRVVQRLLDEGYVDSLQAVRGEEAGRICSFTTLHPGQRVDYIFTWGIDRPRLTGAWIEQDRLAKYASDHYPTALEVST